MRGITGYYRRQAKAKGFTQFKGGSVTFVQRFGGSINLNPHYHALVLDGVYARRNDQDQWRFVAALRLKDSELHKLTETITFRLKRLLEKRGVISEAECNFDRQQEELPLLSGVQQASVRSLIALGERCGQPVRKLRNDIPAAAAAQVRRRLGTDPQQAIHLGSLCCAASGFTVHAKRRLAAHSRQQLEHLCQYVGRPPISQVRLKRLDGSDLRLELKRPWQDGTTHIVLSEMELMEKLAALVAPPRFHTVRYHGVLGPNSKLRRQIVPKATSNRIQKKGSSSRYLWAELLKRIFLVDILSCSCGGYLKLVAIVTDPSSVWRYLKGTGDVTVGVTTAKPLARAPPQLSLCF